MVLWILPFYILYNFINNQYLNLKLNDYIRQSVQTQDIKYLLFRNI